MKTFLLVLMLVGSSLFAIAQEQQQYDAPGVFSFTYGDGWSKGARKNAAPKELDWLVSTSNKDANFHTEVTESEMSFDNWVNAIAKGVSPERVLTSRDSFATSSGLRGYKLTWKIKGASGQEFVRQQYFFRGKRDAKIQLVGLCPAADAPTFGPIYDSFAKSLVLPK